MIQTSRAVRGIVLLLVLAIAAPEWMYAVIPAPELPDPGSASMSREQQIQLGQQARQQVYQQMPVLSDSSAVTQYIQQLGRRLAAVIPSQNSWPFEFHVVEQSDINAFAVPGGPMFVNLGTIVAAQNEAQLAGVMAHEMAHVYMMHSAKGAQKQGTTQALGQILGGLLGAALGGTAGALAQAGMQIGAGIVSMKYSRGDEAQADAVGAIIMWKAGYNPIELANFFKALEQEGGSGPQFMSDHPNPGNRLQAITDEVRNWPQKNYRQDNQQFLQVQSQAKGLKSYTAQEISQMAKSGQIRNTGASQGPSSSQGSQGSVGGTIPSSSSSDVFPNGSYQQFNQGAVKMQYPGNWQVFGGNDGSVTIAPQAGVSRSGVAYGVILNNFSGQGARSVDDAMNQLVSQLQQSNPELRAAGSSESIRVNGILGRSIDMLGNSPLQGQNGRATQEHDWMVLLPQGQGSYVYAVFISPQKDFSNLKNTYQQMLRTLHVK